MTKIKKANVRIVVVSAALALACALFAGCASSQEAPSDAVAGTETTPRLMPAYHQKYADDTGYQCYGCHGATDRGNPNARNATAMPDGHYVNNDPSTQELDPIRNECRSCHSVDPNKEMHDDSYYEEAEEETGQHGSREE
ncbi:hypothetical protein [uncultured Slackia sp.]|uniref:hypothetical protein n=1 Tax=uncultured Slackia sp. TaxID=665903 RepID=UPI0025CCC7B0|nr:hypothetical protein [uncultured Slackia sp.]